jgi:amino acid adenylation domain-containing protein
MEDHADALRGCIEYNTDLFDEGTIARLPVHFQTLLEGIVADPDRRLSQLPLLDEAGRRQVLVEWNETRADFPKDKCVHELIEEQAERTPDAVAVVFDEDQLTYRELNERANALASELQALGVGPEVCVGVCVKRSLEMMVGLLGILKAGGAYVPLDPTYPKERLAFMLRDAQARVLLTQESLRDQFPFEMANLKRLCLDTSPRALRISHPGSRTRTRTGDEDELRIRPLTLNSRHSTNLAYVIYTSGSTGRPKGVMLSHGHAAAYMDWCSEVFAPSEADRFSSHAPFHFDLSILDVHLPLRHGARLVLFDDPTGKDPARLAPLIAEKRISVWYSTPSILTLLLEYGRLEQHDWSALRLVLFAGEVFPVKHLRRLKSVWTAPAYYNLYGPTETNVCTFFRIPDRVPEDRSEPFPIGKPCAHVRARVTGEDGRDVAPGSEGELCIAGPAVMQGYWNLPEQTARAFWHDAEGERWYRTGDLVVEEEGGDYVYLGRRDRMVKRRGYRVELGEIEACLYRHPAVQEAAVVAVPDAERGLTVRAFLTLRPDAEKRPSVIALKRFCAENLPGYMIPDAFSFPDALPKTSTHKIDYQTLQGMT